MASADEVVELHNGSVRVSLKALFEAVGLVASDELPDAVVVRDIDTGAWRIWHAPEWEKKLKDEADELLEQEDKTVAHSQWLAEQLRTHPACQWPWMAQMAKSLKATFVLPRDDLNTDACRLSNWELPSVYPWWLEHDRLCTVYVLLTAQGRHASEYAHKMFRAALDKDDHPAPGYDVGMAGLHIRRESDTEDGSTHDFLVLLRLYRRPEKPLEKEEEPVPLGAALQRIREDVQALSKEAHRVLRKFFGSFFNDTLRTPQIFEWQESALLEDGRMGILMNQCAVQPTAGVAVSYDMSQVFLNFPSVEYCTRGSGTLMPTVLQPGAKSTGTGDIVPSVLNRRWAGPKENDE